MVNIGKSFEVFHQLEQVLRSTPFWCTSKGSTGTIGFTAPQKHRIVSGVGMNKMVQCGAPKLIS